MAKKRSMATVADEIKKSPSGIESEMRAEEAPSALEGVAAPKSSYTTGNEHLRLSDVELNYKNKRVVTQLVRFIPDELVAEAISKSDNKKATEEFILQPENLKRILVNNIVREFRKSDALIDSTNSNNSAEKSDLIEMRNYTRHDDLYDPDLEGIFIGKGICFHNIKTDSAELTKLIDDFVDAVNLNGSSIDSEKQADVVEKPQVIKVGGQRARLVFGHSRYCYLVYAYGLNLIYAFLSANNSEKQNRKILLENNSKRSETGYEQLLSYYHTAKETGASTLDEQLKTLAISRSEYFRIRPFLEDPKLIDIVKVHGIGESRRALTDALEEVKKGLTMLGHAEITDAMLRDAFVKRLESKKELTDSKRVSTQRLPTIPVKVPQSQEAIDKLLFTDVRSWSKLNIENYDFSNKKGMKQYFSDLIKELSQ